MKYNFNLFYFLNYVVNNHFRRFELNHAFKDRHSKSRANTILLYYSIGEGSKVFFPIRIFNMNKCIYSDSCIWKLEIVNCFYTICITIDSLFLNLIYSIHPFSYAFIHELTTSSDIHSVWCVNTA